MGRGIFRAWHGDDRNTARHPGDGRIRFCPGEENNLPAVHLDDAMNQIYTVGRGSAAQIKVPKAFDTVGKLHLSLQVLSATDVQVMDLESTNGTFILIGKRWDEIKGSRIVGIDMAIMLGDYRTTPRDLLAEVGGVPKFQYRSSKEEAEPPPLPVKKRTGPRRNEFGEIVHE